MTESDINIIKDTKNRTAARKQAQRQTDWDKWGDRIIILLIIALPAYIIGRSLVG